MPITTITKKPIKAPTQILPKKSPTI
jgi:hypothetical protein